MIFNLILYYIITVFACRYVDIMTSYKRKDLLYWAWFTPILNVIHMLICIILRSYSFKIKEISFFKLKWWFFGYKHFENK